MINNNFKRFTAKALSTALAVLLILLTLPVSALGAGAGSLKYINTKSLTPNLDYTNTVYWNETYSREESYSLSCRPGGEAFPIVIKDDTVYGTVTIDESITYAKSLGYNVLAGMNAGFFAPSGVPLGLFIEDGIYKSSPAGLPAVMFKEDGSMMLAESPEITMHFFNGGDGQPGSNLGNTLKVTNLNKMRNSYGGLYLYSSDFSSVSTRTSSPGWFIRFEILEGKLMVGGNMQLRVVEMFESDGAVPIGEGYLVLSASGTPGLEYSSFAPENIVDLTILTNTPMLNEAKWATGTGDVIVKNGDITDSTQWDKALLERHPRTAIGLKADGTVVTYVLDGRNSTYGNGLPLMSLAEEMKSLGCVTAVNLDGGGSSVMSVQIPGSESVNIVNRPSDGSARKCSTHILFVTRNNVSDGVARNLALSNDGKIVLAGSSFELGYTATDISHKPVTAPIDVFADLSTLGAITGNTYTAGPVGGTDKLQLLSASTGANGTGEVFIITSPTSLTAYGSSGPAISKVNIAQGGILELFPVATFYRKQVVSQPSSFKYTVMGDIGTITEDGVFTATEHGNCAGTIIITAGTCSISLSVTVQGFSDITEHWAKEFINELYANGIVSGITPSTYVPENNIRRSDFVLMLYRAAGLPTLTGSAETFVDVAPDAYYAAAVAWARETGITTGIGDNKFDPLSDLTREQAFTFVYRSLNLLKIEIPSEFTPMLQTFSDSADVSEYAVVPSETLISLGIVGGSDGHIAPKAPLNRAQMAKILCVTLRLQRTGDAPVHAEEIPVTGSGSGSI